MAGIVKNLAGQIGRGMLKGLRIGLAVGVAAGLLIAVTTPGITLLALAATTFSTTAGLGGVGLCIGGAVGAIKGLFSSPPPDGEVLVDQAEAACPAQGAGGPAPSPEVGAPAPVQGKDAAVAQEVQDVADVLKTQGGSMGAEAGAAAPSSWQERIASQQAETGRAR